MYSYISLWFIMYYLRRQNSQRVQKSYALVAATANKANAATTPSKLPFVEAAADQLPARLAALHRMEEARSNATQIREAEHAVHIRDDDEWDIVTKNDELANSLSIVRFVTNFSATFDDITGTDTAEENATFCKLRSREDCGICRFTRTDAGPLCQKKKNGPK